MRGAIVTRYAPWAIIPITLAVYAVMTGRLCPTCPVSLVGPRSVAVAAPPTGGSHGSVRGLVLPGLDGRPVRLDEQIGTPLIIDIWASWCGPCRYQRQILARLEAAGAVRVIAASVDDDVATVRRFVEAHGSLGVDAMATAELLRAAGGVEALPTLVWVDARGQIRDVTVGALTAEQVRARLRELGD